MEDALTFGHVISAVNFDENVCSLKVHSIGTVQKGRIRVDIILDVNKTLAFGYFS